MARSIFLLEDGTGGFQLESGFGDLLLELSSAGVGGSGSITVVDQPLSNVSVSWIGPSSGNVFTDIFGNWDTGESLADGQYVFTPSLLGYTFLPPLQIVVFAGQDIVELNFIASSFFTAGSFPPPEIHANFAGIPGSVYIRINNPDNQTGTNTAETLNENLPLKVVLANQGARGEIRGRFDQFNVINNPG